MGCGEPVNYFVYLFPGVIIFFLKNRPAFLESNVKCGNVSECSRSRLNFSTVRRGSRFISTGLYSVVLQIGIFLLSFLFTNTDFSFRIFWNLYPTAEQPSKQQSENIESRPNVKIKNHCLELVLLLFFKFEQSSCLNKTNSIKSFPEVSQGFCQNLCATD